MITEDLMHKKPNHYLDFPVLFKALVVGHVEAVGAAAGAGWRCLEIPYGSNDFTPTADPGKNHESLGGIQQRPVEPKYAGEIDGVPPSEEEHPFDSHIEDDIPM